MLTAERAAARAGRLLGDHAALRRLLNESGRCRVRAAEAATLGEVPDAIRELGLPLVVRRTDGAGRRRVGLLSTAAEVTAWFARRAAERARGPYLLEELVEGPVFGVLTLTVEGSHQVLALTSRRSEGPFGRADVEECYPAVLDDADVAELRAAATALLDLAGWEFGLSYVQAALTDRGAVVLAAEPGAGDRTPTLLRLAAGFDPELWLSRALTGEQVPTPRPETAAATVDFRLHEPGGGGSTAPAAGIAAVAELPYVRVCTADAGTGRVVVEGPESALVAERVASVRQLLGRDQSGIRTG
ncbi:hypothetical protein [Streptacidiphilus rugosus]|uniref:hypothetical protein n=1 Tax=Streptacidiphilus rugosus TaxID=405783 RepID=UPI00069052C9|nr:hypothetical protein [Streptacidiphilus rugosus]